MPLAPLALPHSWGTHSIPASPTGSQTCPAILTPHSITRVPNAVDANALALNSRLNTRRK